MATHEYSRTSEGKSISAGTAYTFTTSAFSVPAGERLVGMKVNNPNISSNMSLRMSGNAETVFGKQGWGTYKSGISSLWSDGNGAKIQFTNPYGAASGTVSTRCTVVFKTEDIPYTAVTKGNKIKASDLNQVSGKSVKAGNVIKSSDVDGKISAGTIITASAFNSKVLGL